MPPLPAEPHRVNAPPLTAVGPRGVLLTDATWYGTLAAARDLGARGIPVTLASDTLLPPARWSRYVERTVRCPPTKDAARFLEWLRALGAREPGLVYYPTSDNAAWLVAVHQESLAANFRLYSPSAPALAVLLDKARLSEEARAAGLHTPDTWCPRDFSEVDRLSRELEFPLMLKPRSQVFPLRPTKGMRVNRREDLIGAWLAWTEPPAVAPAAADRLPDGDLPMLQRCHPASEVIYTLDGFVDTSGEQVAALGCRKLLQRPRRSGAGVVFDEAPVDPSLLAGLLRVFRSCGFRGVFDAEFIDDGGRPLLIDINPRFYNHMAFEIDRGLPLAWLAYLGAVDDRDALAAAIGEAQRVQSSGSRAYVHRLPTRAMLLFQGMSGAMSADERRKWRTWIAAHSGELTDPAVAPGDRWPGVADALHHLRQAVEAPRAFLRSLYQSNS